MKFADLWTAEQRARVCAATFVQTRKGRWRRADGDDCCPIGAALGDFALPRAYDVMVALGLEDGSEQRSKAYELVDRFIDRADGYSDSPFLTEVEIKAHFGCEEG